MINVEEIRDVRISGYSLCVTGGRITVIEKAHFFGVLVHDGKEYPVRGIAERIFLDTPQELRND